MARSTGAREYETAVKFAGHTAAARSLLPVSLAREFETACDRFQQVLDAAVTRAQRERGHMTSETTNN